MGKLISRTLTAAADVKVADHLANGPKTVAELAQLTSTNEDALYRILRALCAAGIFTESGDRTFANNEVSDLLVSNTQGSLHNMVRWINCRPAWAAWERLDYSLETGKPCFDEVFDKQVFDYFQEDKETAEIFHGAMSSFSTMTGHAVAEAYDFSGINKIADLGGGHGALLSTIIAQNPNMRGVLFDLPEVVQGAELGDLKDKIDIESGSFLEGVPQGADAYIMKHIIHDWDDERSIAILNHCRESMSDNGKVLVVDMVITDAPESAFGKLIDIEMLAMTPGGRERTAEEFEALFAQAGFKVARIIPTQSPVCIVEGVKA